MRDALRGGAGPDRPALRFAEMVEMVLGPTCRTILTSYIDFSYLSSPSAAEGGSRPTTITGSCCSRDRMPVLLKFFVCSATRINGGNGSGFLGAATAIAISEGYGLRREQAGPDRVPAIRPVLSAPADRH
ncbi:hypothetical protein GCM10009610_70080 [Pseudonocardia xinjiangensis]